MIKSYEDYRKLALRSIKPHDSKDMAILDWTLGLGGEAGEILELFNADVGFDGEDKMLWAKEIGDVLWYMTALVEELGIGDQANQVVASASKDTKSLYRVGTLVLDLVLEASRVQEAVKHYIFHKEVKAIDKVQKHLVEMYALIYNLALKLEMSVKDIAALNAAKLAHRFNLKAGGAFSVAGSKDRHKSEVAFEDTATFKRLYAQITLDVVDIGDDDLEVF